MINKSKLFAKRFGAVISAFSLLGLGGYSIYLGRDKIGAMIGASALVFAGGISIVFGAIHLYKVLMHEEK
jgi:hypothetical protein